MVRPVTGSRGERYIPEGESESHRRLDLTSRGNYTSVAMGRCSAGPRSPHCRETVPVPRIASAKKNMRKTRAATARNRAQRSSLRTALKTAKADASSSEEKLKAVQLLDRAARKGLIHPNAAARQKSSLAKAK